MNRLRWIAAVLLLLVPVWGFNTRDEKDKEYKDEQKIQWISLEKAQELVKESPREIFIDVYTDWCSWCKVMDKKTFRDPQVVEYVNEHYYAVKLNAESEKEVKFNDVTLTEAELAEAFGVTAYPTVVLVNQHFDLVAPAPGFRKAKEFKKMLEEFSDYAKKNSAENQLKD
jgi:thioredoxin-related protein